MNIQTEIDRGMCCAECTTFYVAAHGVPVICRFCARRIGPDAVNARGLAIARNKERS